MGIFRFVHDEPVCLSCDEARRHETRAGADWPKERHAFACSGEERWRHCGGMGNQRHIPAARYGDAGNPAWAVLFAADKSWTPATPPVFTGRVEAGGIWVERAFVTGICQIVGIQRASDYRRADLQLIPQGGIVPTMHSIAHQNFAEHERCLHQRK